MKILTGYVSSDIPVDKILANWAVASAFIYDPNTTIDDLKTLLRREVLNKNRELLVERLSIRLLSLLKQQLKAELTKDIKELHGRIREIYGDVPSKPG